MSVSHVVTVPTLKVHLPEPPPPSKFDQERAAFYRLLPNLLATHRGQYVAIHGEQVVDSGQDQIEVALRVQSRVGRVPIFVHFVSEDGAQPVVRSGVARLPTPGGGA